MSFNPFRRAPHLPTNDDLLNAITFLATAGTPEARRNFYVVLLNSTLFVAQETGESRPILLVDKSGEIMLPVFTDLERLHRVFPDAKRYGALAARDLFRLALGSKIHDININPEHGPGGYLDFHELEALANGTIPDLPTAAEPSLAEPTFIPMGDPKLPTQEVLDKMTLAARSLLTVEPSVEEAYIILTKSSQEDSKLTIALRFEATTNVDDMTAFSRSFVPAIENVIGRPLDLLWLDGERYRAIQSVVEPFYRRGARYY